MQADLPESACATTDQDLFTSRKNGTASSSQMPDNPRLDREIHPLPKSHYPHSEGRGSIFYHEPH